MPIYYKPLSIQFFYKLYGTRTLKYNLGICRLILSTSCTRRRRPGHVSHPLYSVYVGSKQTELYAIKVYFPGPSKEQAFEL